MATDLTIQGEVVVNSEKAESAFDRLGIAADQMARELSEGAGKAGDALDQTGKSASEVAAKFTRGEAAIVASARRSTEALQLLGKTASEKLEFKIDAKGFDRSKFEPALQALRDVEAQAARSQQVATGSLDGIGISAKQTAAALRGVPAQFTDIVTSLQGGQAPLTVFIQQGGQLKDMFGGAGAAARALGGYVLGLVNPFTVAAAAVGALAYAYTQGAKEQEAFRNALISTGNAAGTNAAQLKAQAQQISSVIGTQGKAAESLTALASTGKVGAETLRDAAQAAILYERATGQALDKTAEQFASLRNEPLSAVLKLNDGMNFLTESTFRQIKTLEDQGRVSEAANVAQRAFADTLTSRAGEMERNLGAVERGWIKVKDAAKAAWDAILNVGRASTTTDQLAEVRKQITMKENQLANGGFGANDGGAAFGRPSTAATARLQAELAGLKAQAAALEGVAYASKTAAEEERARGDAVKASGELAKNALKYETDLEKQRREVAVATQTYLTAIGAGNLSLQQRNQIEADYLKTVQGITAVKEKAEKGRKGGKSQEQIDLEAQMRIYGELAGLSSTYYKELSDAQSQFERGDISQEIYVARVNQLIQKQPFAIALTREQAEVTKALAKISEEGAKSHAKYIEELSRGGNAAVQQADKLRVEEQAAAIAAKGYYSLAEAIELVTIARLEEKRDGLLGNEDAFLTVQKEINARKELMGLIRAKEVREANAEAARDAEREWRRAADDINRSLTDALLRGFESGKGFAQNLRDTLVNMFKTLVLRPVISAVLSPVSGAISGFFSTAAGQVAGSAAAQGVGSTAATSFAGSALGNAVGGVSGLGSLLSGSGGGAALSAGSSAAFGLVAPLAGIAALFALANATKGETRAGGQYGFGIDGAGISNRRGTTYSDVNGAFFLEGPSGGDPYQAQAMKGIDDTVAAINARFKGLGSSAAVSNFNAGYESSGKDRGGVFAGGALSSGRQFGESGLGNNYAGTLFETTSTQSPDAATAIKNFATDLLQVSIQALQAEDGLPRVIKDILQIKGKDIVAESLTDEAAAKILEQVDTVIASVNSLTEAAKLLPFEDLANLSFDAAAGLIELAGGIQALGGNLTSFYQTYFSPEEQQAQTRKNVTATLEKVGVDLPATRDEFKELVLSFMAMGEAGQPALAALLSVNQAFASITQSAEEAAASIQAQQEAARQSAFTALQQAAQIEKGLLDARREVLSQSISEKSSLAGVLGSNVRDLRGQAAPEAVATQGKDFIAQALATAKATGYLPDTDLLTNAINGARGGLSNNVYGTQFEQNRDRLVLAGQLSQLEEINGKQLTFEEQQLKAVERQVKALEETVDFWQQQIDLSTQGIEATLSVVDAVEALKKLMFPDKKPTTPTGPAAYGGGGAVFGGGGSSAVDPGVVDENGLRTYADGSTQQLTENELYLYRKFGNKPIPYYDVGTNRVPNDGLAFLHKDEAVIPKAFNPYLGGDTGNSELAAAVDRLAAQNAVLSARLEAIESNTAGMPQMSRQIDTYTNGGQFSRQKALS